MTNEDKSRRLGSSLERVTVPYVRASLKLQEVFGLRREESNKFQPSYAGRISHVLLKGSWTKGGRPRVIPITSPEQYEALREAHRVAGSGSLIPPHKTYIEHRHTYDGQCQAAGLSRMHGLRHLYAQTRYEELTGWKAPAAGGPTHSMLNQAQRVLDSIVRQDISHELGYERIEITAVYPGAVKIREGSDLFPIQH